MRRPLQRGPACAVCRVAEAGLVLGPATIARPAVESAGERGRQRRQGSGATGAAPCARPRPDVPGCKGREPWQVERWGVGEAGVCRSAAGGSAAGRDALRGWPRSSARDRAAPVAAGRPGCCDRAPRSAMRNRVRWTAALRRAEGGRRGERAAQSGAGDRT